LIFRSHVLNYFFDVDGKIRADKVALEAPDAMVRGFDFHRPVALMREPGGGDKGADPANFRTVAALFAILPGDYHFEFAGVAIQTAAGFSLDVRVGHGKFHVLKIEDTFPNLEMREITARLHQGNIFLEFHKVFGRRQSL
jgi:hypothetical protein